MPNLWTTGKKLIINDARKFLLCDDCPCDEIIECVCDLCQAGTLIESFTLVFDVVTDAYSDVCCDSFKTITVTCCPERGNCYWCGDKVFDPCSANCDEDEFAPDSVDIEAHNTNLDGSFTLDRAEPPQGCSPPTCCYFKDGIGPANRHMWLAFPGPTGWAVQLWFLDPITGWGIQQSFFGADTQACTSETLWCDQTPTPTTAYVLLTARHNGTGCTAATLHAEAYMEERDGNVWLVVELVNGEGDGHRWEKDLGESPIDCDFDTPFTMPHKDIINNGLSDCEFDETDVTIPPTPPPDQQCGRCNTDTTPTAFVVVIEDMTAPCTAWNGTYIVSGPNVDIATGNCSWGYLDANVAVNVVLQAGQIFVEIFAPPGTRDCERNGTKVFTFPTNCDEIANEEVQLKGPAPFFLDDGTATLTAA